MKFTAALALAIAPVALAKATHNVYPRENKDVNNKDVGNNKGSNKGSNIAAPVIVNEASTTEIILLWVNGGGGQQTQVINSQVTVTTTVTAGAVGGAQTTAAAAETTAAGGSVGTSSIVGAGATHTVTVGGQAGLVFSPAETQIAAMDVVVFEFLSTNHSVTQSTFASPCIPMEGGFKAGFHANPNNSVVPPPQVAMQVMVNTPTWFFCGQTGHCGKGMVLSVNPSLDKTAAMFSSMAVAQNGTGATSGIVGGNGTVAGSQGSAGSSSAALLTPVATTAVAAGAQSTGSAGSVVQGTGTLQAGQCLCAVACVAAGFPSDQQGLGSFNGVAGAIPASMAVAL